MSAPVAPKETATEKGCLLLVLVSMVLFVGSLVRCSMNCGEELTKPDEEYERQKRETQLIKTGAGDLQRSRDDHWEHVCKERARRHPRMNERVSVYGKCMDEHREPPASRDDALQRGKDIMGK
jgi:hypothetical protein